jgi:hypothetical protein
MSLCSSGCKRTILQNVKQMQWMLPRLEAISMQ